MSDAIEITRGACLDIDIIWTDENGAPMDMSGYTWSVFDAQPPMVASFDTTDAATGKIKMHVGDTSAFGLGRVNHFRLSGAPALGSCAETTERIWVGVA